MKNFATIAAIGLIAYLVLGKKETVVIIPPNGQNPPVKWNPSQGVTPGQIAPGGQYLSVNNGPAKKTP